MISTGIFGGSFNPIHNGHVELARQLLASAGLDEIWFVVSPQNPFKRAADLLDDDLRLKMVELALEGEPRMHASDYEFCMPRPSYMWHTLQSMSRDYPDRRFVLLIGADNWERFSEWYAWRDILSHYRIVIYPRGGSAVDAVSLPEGVSLVDTRLIDISSTQVRQFIVAGRPINGLVPDSVARYISDKGLYAPKV